MQDKQITFGQTALSIIRIECLLEELIFQQIINRTANVDEANEKFKIALRNIDNEMKQRIEELSSVDEEPNYDEGSLR